MNTDRIRFELATLIADAVRIEDVDVEAGVKALRRLGYDPDRFDVMYAAASAFILVDLDDDPKNVHSYIEHSVRGRTLDKAAILAQTEKHTLDTCVARIAATKAVAA